LVHVYRARDVLHLFYDTRLMHPLKIILTPDHSLLFHRKKTLVRPLPEASDFLKL